MDIIVEELIKFIRGTLFGYLYRYPSCVKQVL